MDTLCLEILSVVFDQAPKWVILIVCFPTDARIPESDRVPVHCNRSGLVYEHPYA